MPLHIDYRPKGFNEVMGNKGVISSLKSLLNRKEDIPHAFIFQGPSGCGKTTLARIVADKLGCPEKINEEVNGDFVEINASNNRGIDTARGIMQTMHYHPSAAKCRVWLLDECFAKDTKIKTPQGNISIQDIQKGQIIYNISGEAEVKRIFKNKIPLNRVTKIKLNNQKNIFCSSDHLFLTENSGWVKAKNIQKKDLILKFNYNTMVSTNQLKEAKNDRKEMPLLSKIIFDAKQKTKILFGFLSKQIKKETCNYYMPNMRILRERIQNNTGRQIYSSFLQSNLCRQISAKASSYNKNKQIQKESKQCSNRKRKIKKTKSWLMGKISQAIFGQNEEKQSLSQSQSNCQSQGNKKNKRNIACLVWKTWREWALYACSNTSCHCFGVANGGSCQNWPFSFRQKRVSSLLQSGFRPQKVKISDRSRRKWAQIEKEYIARQKENRQINGIRVESIEIFQRGNNDESFSGIINHKERNQGFVEFYDLEIDGHPSYFANEILVHNCHQATKDFQNSLLKALEDSPKHAYFILCTTEPEKLLKTIRNRCSTFEVESLQENEIIQLLDWVLKKEDFDIPEDVKEEIADIADGCSRQALVVLDQIIDLPENEMLGAVKDTKVDEKEVIELCRAMLKGTNWKKISGILKGLKSSEPENIRRAVMGYMSAVLLNGGQSKAALILDIFKDPVFHSGFPGIVLAAYQALD